MANKQIVIDAPKHPVVRYLFKDDRHMELDLRGIRNPHSPFNGRLNPSKGGQKKFLSPEHLKSACDEYFDSCFGPMLDKWGNLVKDDNGMLVKVQVKPFTVSGLALHLGVTTQSLKKYAGGSLDTILDEMRAQTDDTLTFSRVILAAKQTIEAYAEGRMYDRDGQRGAQYILDCCFGWLSHREEAEIEYRKKEFDLKRQLIDDGDEEGQLTVNIIRGRRDQNETS